MTWGELKEVTTMILEKEKEEYKAKIAMYYQLAQLIGVAVNEPKRFPKNLTELYPDLFENKKTIPMPNWLKEKYAKRGGH